MCSSRPLGHLFFWKKESKHHLPNLDPTSSLQLSGLNGLISSLWKPSGSNVLWRSFGLTLGETKKHLDSGLNRSNGWSGPVVKTLNTSMHWSLWAALWVRAKSIQVLVWTGPTRQSGPVQSLRYRIPVCFVFLPDLFNLLYVVWYQSLVIQKLVSG